MVTFVALMKPYVETHPIGLLWVALWVITAVIELPVLPGAAKKRPKKTAGSRFVLRVTVIPAVIVLVPSQGSRRRLRSARPSCPW